MDVAAMGWPVPSAPSPRRPRCRLVRLLLLIATLLLAAPPARVSAEEQSPPLAATERSVKAAFLYKFLAYVDWPAAAFPQADSPLVIGVMGADDIAAELTQITTGRTFNTHPITVRRLHEGDALAGLHMLFVGHSESGHAAGTLRRAQQRPVLTVTEAPGALEQGAIINFVLTEGRVRFEISVDAADKAGLKLSSRLLAVAQNVRQGAGS